MTTQMSKLNPLMKIFHSTLVQLPAPSNLSSMWNFGSLLFMCLFAQIITGLLLSSAYSTSMLLSFPLVNLNMEMNPSGWLTRYLHANTASLFFLFLYLHTARGIYYGSFLFKSTWMVGTSILLLSMATAFLGYVLPVNQMSFWGASVITNLFSEVPYIGPTLVHLIWGALSVSDPTLTRFFTFHFLIPFIILALVMIHITFLHQTGSNNPLGLTANLDKMPFHPYYSAKDIMGVTMTAILFLFMCMYYPLLLGDDENFTLADPAATPTHIQPEWYFLFAYAILRSVPNKLGGVIALILSVMILYTLPFTFTGNMKSLSFFPMNKLMFWSFATTVLLLTWIGAQPVEDPYVLTGQILSCLYFIYFLMNPLLMKTWSNLSTI